MADRLPTFDDVLAARARIAPYLVHTPLLENPALNARVGGRVLVKGESLQRVGAFKFRGAYNKIVQVDRARYPGGVVATSSGNHAQGVAAAVSLVGMKSVILMPKDAPAIKVARTKAFGGEVIPYDRETEDRDAIARRICAETRAALVHPFHDADIITGQGTVGLEIVEQAKSLGAKIDAVLVPSSGGGFLAGMALVIKELIPSADVHVVEPAGFDDFKRSLASGRIERNTRLSGTICDALLMPAPGEMNFAITRLRVKNGLAIADADVEEAMRFAFTELKLVLEPAGAITLAAVLTRALPTEGRTIAIVLSGGNADPDAFARVITGGRWTS